MGTAGLITARACGVPCGLCFIHENPLYFTYSGTSSKLQGKEYLFWQPFQKHTRKSRILPFRRHGAHPTATLPGPPCCRHPGRFVHTQGRRLRLTPETGEATGRVCRDVGTVRVRCSGPPRRSGRFRVAGLNAAARASEGVPSLSPALAVVFRGDRTQDPGMPGQSGGESRAGRGANPAAIVRDAVVTAHRSEAL